MDYKERCEYCTLDEKRKSLGESWLTGHTFEIGLGNVLGVSKIVGEYDEGFDGEEIFFCPMCGKDLNEGLTRG